MNKPLFSLEGLLYSHQMSPLQNKELLNILIRLLVQERDSMSDTIDKLNEEIEDLYNKMDRASEHLNYRDDMD